MKKTLSILLLVVSALSITLIYSCKKNDNTTTNPGNGTSGTLDNTNQTNNDDANFFKSENDNANGDVNTDMGNYSTMQARLAEGSGVQTVYPHPCGCDNPDTSMLHSLHPQITYVFNGTSNCWGRHRSGTIVVTLTSGTHWSDSAAVLTFNFINYKVTGTGFFSSKSITFNGTKTLKNVNGSKAIDLIAVYLGTRRIILQDRAINIQVAFSSGLTATWNTAYTSQWSHNPLSGVYYYRGMGDTTVAGYTNTYAWGVNRFGKNFYSHTGDTVVCNSVCGYGEPMSGQVTHNVDSASLTLNLGVDQNGNPYTGAGCPWGFNAQWQFPHSNGSANFQYW